MILAKQYQPESMEPEISTFWQRESVYRFQPDSNNPVFSIDTPPPTVSGHLHLGHVYSYTHPDIIARFQRMRGYNVFYPMGFDDNGLPTERLVEKRLGITSHQVGKAAFAQKCQEISKQSIEEYQLLWERLGLSIDWRYTYHTNDENARRICQLSFIDLYKKGIAYRRESPAIWCPECRTSIAQADLNDLEIQSEFITLRFDLENGGSLPIATTRPELLPACVAVFVNPGDSRHKGLVGRHVIVPLIGTRVPVLEDPDADPQKGTGIVMCCTFGDSTDVAWWRRYNLPLIQAIGPDGRMDAAAGKYQGLSIDQARRQIKDDLDASQYILDRWETTHSIRVHERCDTPVEFIIAKQWFIRVMDVKDQLLTLADRTSWHPKHMLSRYRSWVKNLGWDWCISRQRDFGIPFPLWYCRSCGEVILALEDQLPVDPSKESPGGPCACGSTDFLPESDVFDTWATSSMSPQIVAGWEGTSFDDPANGLYERVFPFSLRPQAHEIIRTWAFYTICKSHFHFNQLPWSDVLISGWGIAGEGMGKISKSRGGGPMPPLEMIQNYSADAVRYWASSTGPGKDTLISEEKIKLGSRLVTKLWNVARFLHPFTQFEPASLPDPTTGELPDGNLSPADRWILSRLQQVIQQTTANLEEYDYAAAKSEIESFFWQDFADNYLEMCKQRMYGPAGEDRSSAILVANWVFIKLLQLFAPYLPFVTEAIYQQIYQGGFASASSESKYPESMSIHLTRWPEPDPRYEDEQAQWVGSILVEIATAVRRFKSEDNLSLGTELDRLELALGDDLASTPTASWLSAALSRAEADLRSITRARGIDIKNKLDPDSGYCISTDHVMLCIILNPVRNETEP